MEKEYSLGEDIRTLPGFIGRCNAALGRSAVVSAGSDGSVSAIDLTPAELVIVRRVNRGLEDVAQFDTSGLLVMTPAQFDAYLDANVTTLTQARAALKLILRLVWKLYKAQE